MTKDELQRFCAEESDPRYYLREPWSRDGFTYATNGYIIVRVSRMPDVPENDLAPDATKVFTETPIAEFIPVPVCEMPADIPCPYCKGKGYSGTKKNHDDCLECNATGTIPNSEASHIIINASFADRYLALIQGWEIAPNGLTCASIRDGHGADGLLMPRNV